MVCYFLPCVCSKIVPADIWKASFSMLVVVLTNNEINKMRIKIKLEPRPDLPPLGL